MNKENDQRVQFLNYARQYIGLVRKRLVAVSE